MQVTKSNHPLVSNVIRSASRARRVPTRSVILIVWPLSRHARDIGVTLNRLSHVIIRMRDLVIVVDCGIVAHAFDEVN